MGQIIRVSAGILTRPSQLLICQRRAGDLHALKWEFPGGKLNNGENDAACLRRELQEELGIQASIGAELYHTSHTYPTGRSVALTFSTSPRSKVSSSTTFLRHSYGLSRRSFGTTIFLKATRSL